jgi:hypothetical protein
MKNLEVAIRAWLDQDVPMTLTAIHNALCHNEYIPEKELGALLDAIIDAKRAS